MIQGNEAMTLWIRLSIRIGLGFLNETGGSNSFDPLKANAGGAYFQLYEWV